MAPRCGSRTQAAKADFHTSRRWPIACDVRSAAPGHDRRRRGVRAQRVRARRRRRGGLHRSGAERARSARLGPAGCRWSASARARASGCAAGAIVLREFADPGCQRTAADARGSLRADGASCADSNAQWRGRRQVAKRAGRQPGPARDADDRGIATCGRWSQPELEGIATLQFPWSARAMDEAGAALDRLKPDAWSPTRRPAAGAAR